MGAKFLNAENRLVVCWRNAVSRFPSFEICFGFRISDFGFPARLLVLFLAVVSARAQDGLFPNSGAGAVSPEAAATLVVFNTADGDSKDLAEFYAEKRGIPKANLVGLKCSTFEEINRDEYDQTIADPLRRAMTVNNLWKLREPGSPLSPVEWNKIRFVALMRGIPLKISPAVGYPGDRQAGPESVATHNEAAVDSELALLAMRSRFISGIVTNPYFRAFSSITDFKIPELLLVCRLDGPTPEIVRRMITDSIAAEKEGLAGFAYVDARGLTGDGGYAEGDEWLRNIAAEARKRGSPVVLDNGPDLFPSGYPMKKTALYFGWYSGDVIGALASPGFRFERGAVAVHIHSYSGGTVRSKTSAWVGPLLNLGAAATLGNVYEPYLSLTPNLDVFHERLRAGFTFAESAYMAQRFLSWQTTFVGDPIYRPFRGGGLLEEKPATGEWAEYREGAKLWFGKNRAAGETALRSSARKLRSGIIYEGLGLLKVAAGEKADALDFFKEARALYKDPEDACRVAIHEIFVFKAANRQADAVALARKMIATYPKAAAVNVLALFDVQPAPQVKTPAVQAR